MKKALSLALFLSSFAASGAMAASDCAASVEAPLGGPLRPMERVRDYRPVLQSCRREGGDRLAIRAMKVDGQDLLLMVDPQSLATRLERADCGGCAATTDSEQANARYIHAVERTARQKGKVLPAGAAWLENAGLTHGAGSKEGVFATADLCPSRKPLDRAFLQFLEKTGPGTNIALSVSGLWIRQHPEDFEWLRSEQAAGRLTIAFVNHSFHHFYRLGLPDGENFLLFPGQDRQAEVFDVERLLIANGETPSVFFRFPGLISDPSWMETLRQDHLISLGADAWLANGQRARAGSVVLVHANGNEPFGLTLFESQLKLNALPTPFLPLTAAP